MKLETFESGRGSDGMAVRITEGGHSLYINKPARLALGSPDYYRFVYSKEDGVIGLRAGEEGDYTARAPQAGVVACKSILKYMGYTGWGESRRFDLEVYENVEAGQGTTLIFRLGEFQDA